MEFIYNLFPNLYDWLAGSLHALLSGLNLVKDAENAIVAAIMTIIVVVVLLLWLVLMVLVMIWLERKVAARVQDRVGPNRVGPWGLLQPVADTIKMFIKEDITPTNADRLVHLLAPMVAAAPAVLAFAVIPWGKGMAPVDLNIGLLWIVAIASIGTIGAFMAGYGSNNKFSLLGGMRAVAQIVSYEIPQVLTIAVIALMAGSLSLNKIVEAQGGAGGLGWYIFAIPVGPIAFVIYYISALAEVVRAPFDLPEAESEIVAGYHTEYSGLKWGFFYVAEYFNFFLVCCVAVTLFLGGWQGPFLPPYVWFIIKVYALVILGMWIRMTWPRFRVDQLMGFAWKVLVPIGLVNIILASLFVTYAIPALKQFGLFQY
ncbi:MAG: NADH-quinone oxidoreductase subunit NuoH [Chloroflexi bacterium]|nr:NADH-quinone oxidoreductase subunit NuoH [Chloroflexota bacterium]